MERIGKCDMNNSIFLQLSGYLSVRTKNIMEKRHQRMSKVNPPLASLSQIYDLKILLLPYFVGGFPPRVLPRIKNPWSIQRSR